MGKLVIKKFKKSLNLFTLTPYFHILQSIEKDEKMMNKMTISSRVIMTFSAQKASPCHC